jgi:hypothetical protein
MREFKLKNTMSLSLLLLFVTAHAGEVGTLTTFTPGTPAKASEVNGNFSAVKDAVNANHQEMVSTQSQVTALDSRLDTAEATLASKQTQIGAGCAVGSAIRSIDANGVATCSTINGSSAVTLLASDFSINDDTDLDACRWSRAGRGYFTGTRNGYCTVIAPVHLPDGVRVTELRCSVLNNTSQGYFLETGLYRMTPSAGTTTTIFQTGQSTLSTATIQTMSDTVPVTNTDRIDNLNFGYYVAINEYSIGVAYSTLGNSLALIGCSVRYVP